VISSDLPEATYVRPSVPHMTATFALVSITSFGGGQMSAIRRAVLRNRWVSKDEYLETMAIAQLLPGANSTNVAVLLGGRFAGVLGASAALLATVLPGFAILMLLGLVLLGAHVPALTGALRACAAAAVGLTLANAIEMTLPSRKRLIDLGVIVSVALFVLVLHASLAATLGIFLPVTLLLHRLAAK